MLLNQCLAISLSPIQVVNESPKTCRLKISSEKHEESRESKPVSPQEDNIRRQSNQWALFRQLVEQNLKPLKEATTEEEITLREALTRVDFAGFVVPSWLLLSGSYNDLHCIKWSWSEGSFRPPPGFRIETIGNIRSVNVDYFGISNNNSKEQQQQQQQQVNQQESAGRKNNAQLDGQNHQLEADKQSSREIETVGAQQVRSSRLRNHQQVTSPVGHQNSDPLDALVFDSLVELSRQRSEEPIYVSRLIEHLANSEHSFTADQIETTLEQLARCGSIRLKSDDSQVGELCELVASEKEASRVWSASASKSKSTTLDSGIQSWDQVSSPSNEPTGGVIMLGQHHDLAEQVVGSNSSSVRPDELRLRGSRLRGFSLGRSLSFKPKKNGLQSANPSDRWPQQADTMPINATEALKHDHHNHQQSKMSRNLSSLFRSKSMRTISAANRARGANWRAAYNEQQQQAQFTCDRLGVPGQPLGNRSSRNARQATIDYLSTAQPHKRALSTGRSSLLGTSNKTDELTAGKIVLFLRKLFTIKRLQSRPQPAPLERSERSIERRISGSPVGLANESSAGVHRRPTSLDQQQQRQKSANKKHISASPSSDSSGSSSLIEILDCAPTIDNSRRSLREVSAPRALTSRSTWRLSKRSSSSLSNNSEASCSTAKSTVSQELRRHLDEAYKRHRNCTSQREKEFIDSINVLRQASRHALQNSRSSSKNRQAKSVGTKSGASDTGSSLGGSSCATSRPDRHQVACQCKRVYGDEDVDVDVEEDANNNANYPDDHLDLIRDTALLDAPGTVDHLETESLDGSNNSSHKCLPEPDLHWAELRQTDHLNASLLNNCCVCTSYLSGPTRPLCPLTCCPANPLSCCLSAPMHRHQQASNQMSVDPAADLPDSLPDLCCPLWRSMVYNYCHPPPPPPPPQLFGTATNLHLPEAPRPDQLSRLENFSSKHQVQQHQHNTTIDLKIEIGGYDRATTERQSSGGSKHREPKQSDGNDSLESDQSQTTTDESLNKLDEEFERDSYDSAAKADSLRDGQTRLEATATTTS